MHTQHKKTEAQPKSIDTISANSGNAIRIVMLNV